MPDQYTDPPDWGKIPPVLSVLDVALIFKVTRRAVYRWIADDKLRSYRWFGFHHIFPREYVFSFLNEERREELARKERDTWELNDRIVNRIVHNSEEMEKFQNKFNGTADTSDQIPAGAAAVSATPMEDSYTDEYEEYLSTGQVARMLAVHPETVARWVEEGWLKAFRTPGGRRRYAKSDIEDIITQSREG